MQKASPFTKPLVGSRTACESIGNSVVIPHNTNDFEVLAQRNPCRFSEHIELLTTPTDTQSRLGTPALCILCDPTMLFSFAIAASACRYAQFATNQQPNLTQHGRFREGLLLDGPLLHS